jgi:hypothetical protein
MVENEVAFVELQLGRTNEEIKGRVLWGNATKEMSYQVQKIESSFLKMLLY